LSSSASRAHSKARPYRLTLPLTSNDLKRRLAVTLAHDIHIASSSSSLFSAFRSESESLRYSVSRYTSIDTPRAP
jgi:hypothetical protein